MQKKFSQKNGFTLVEILVVISIIGILTTLAVVAVTNARARAMVIKTQADLKQIRTAIDLLVGDTNKWPNGCPTDVVVNGSSNEVALDTVAAGLKQRPVAGGTDPCVWTTNEVAAWKGPYIDRVVDPWGTTYHFDNDYTPYSHIDCSKTDEPETMVLVSFGPNGTGLNEYDCDDIFLKLL